MTAYLTDLRIGATIDTLLHLTDVGLPDPVSWTYAPYSQTKMCGDGHSKGFGFPVATWQWEALSQHQINILLEMFEHDYDASVACAITTYKDVGIKRNPANFTCIMHRPVDGNGKEMFPESAGPTYNNVVVRFTRLEEESVYL